jgi:hypothetical protein
MLPFEKEGTIIYFTPFYFSNGNKPKNKYFIVLKNFDTEALLASLPTSHDHIPNGIEVEASKCIELPSCNFNCFVFKEEEMIATNSFFFPRQTHIYGQQVDLFSKSMLRSVYDKNGIDYIIVGELFPDVFAKVVHCLKSSSVVKRKYKRIL